MFACGRLFGQPRPRKDNGVETAVSSAIAQLSRDLMVGSIIVSTHTDYTASLVFFDWPSAPIISLTSSFDQALRKLPLIWGVFPCLVRSRIEGNKSFAFAEAFMKRMKLAGGGDFLLRIAGGDQPEWPAIRAFISSEEERQK